MVKIYSSCGAKNFDDARHCMNCAADIKRVVKQPLATDVSLSNNVADELQDLKPRGYTPQPWQGRIYSKLGLAFAGLYFVFFFIYSAFIILFIFSTLTIILGKVAISNGDESIGKFALAIGIILFLLTLILFILALIL